MQVSFMCGSHPRHLYVANELYKAGFLKALVIEKRESFNPRPNPTWSDKDKELFIKYYIEGYKLCEIAKKDKTNITNLHSRLSRGRKRIKERFKVQGGINYEK